MRIESVSVGYIGTNCYLIMNEASGEGFIVDPGHEYKKIAAKIEEMGMKPTAIILTHGHFDHIMAVNELRSLYNINVYAGADEEALLMEDDLNRSGGMLHQPYVTKADVLLEDNREIEIAGIRIRTLFTPGHTAGSVCYYLFDENVLLSGDTLFFGNVGRTDLPTGNHSQLVASIRDRLIGLPGDTKVLPGHGASTTIEYERMNNYLL